jgi:hypothetical protein
VSGTIAGATVDTTTGGGSATPTVVATLAELNAAAGGAAPAVIYVTGNIGGNVTVGSNKTIAGVCGATITGHIALNGSVNVIVRNLTVVGYNCTDAAAVTAQLCSSGADSITVINAAHHIWFDHDDISDGSDGNLDITQGSDFVTVSWTKFHYSAARVDLPGPGNAGVTGHRFSNLIGAADNNAIDVGHLNTSPTGAAVVDIGTAFVPPYAYALDPASAVQAGAGPGSLRRSRPRRAHRGGPRRRMGCRRAREREARRAPSARSTPACRAVAAGGPRRPGLARTP